MSRLSISTGIALVLAFISLHAHATSFDCAKAVSFAEKSICADTVLSLLDEQLNSQYVRALDSAANRNQVRIEQRVRRTGQA